MYVDLNTGAFPQVNNVATTKSLLKLNKIRHLWNKIVFDLLASKEITTAVHNIVSFVTPVLNCSVIQPPD